MLAVEYNFFMRKQNLIFRMVQNLNILTASQNVYQQGHQLVYKIYIDSE